MNDKSKMLNKQQDRICGQVDADINSEKHEYNPLKDPVNYDNSIPQQVVIYADEEESHTRSRSMETSLRMRLDNGTPLTPKFLGYTYDQDGNLIVNPDEALSVKQAIYMHLSGYSTQQIADIFNALGRRTYLGNVSWTSADIVQILRNERQLYLPYSELKIKSQKSIQCGEKND